MTRTSLAEKKRVVKSLSKRNRPIYKIAKMKKGNDSPEYASGSLLERSKTTAAARTARYKRVLGQITGSDD